MSRVQTEELPDAMQQLISQAMVYIVNFNKFANLQKHINLETQLSIMDEKKLEIFLAGPVTYAAHAIVAIAMNGQDYGVTDGAIYPMVEKVLTFLSGKASEISEANLDDGVNIEQFAKKHVLTSAEYFRCLLRRGEDKKTYDKNFDEALELQLTGSFGVETEPNTNEAKPIVHSLPNYFDSITMRSVGFSVLKETQEATQEARPVETTSKLLDVMGQNSDRYVNRSGEELDKLRLKLKPLSDKLTIMPAANSSLPDIALKNTHKFDIVVYTSKIKDAKDIIQALRGEIVSNPHWWEAKTGKNANLELAAIDNVLEMLKEPAGVPAWHCKSSKDRATMVALRTFDLMRERGLLANSGTGEAQKKELSCVITAPPITTAQVDELNSLGVTKITSLTGYDPLKMLLHQVPVRQSVQLWKSSSTPMQIGLAFTVVPAVATAAIVAGGLTVAAYMLSAINTRSVFRVPWKLPKQLLDLEKPGANLAAITALLPIAALGVVATVLSAAAWVLKPLTYLPKKLKPIKAHYKEKKINKSVSAAVSQVTGVEHQVNKFYSSGSVGQGAANVRDDAYSCIVGLLKKRLTCGPPCAAPVVLAKALSYANAAKDTFSTFLTELAQPKKVRKQLKKAFRNVERAIGLFSSSRSASNQELKQVIVEARASGLADRTFQPSQPASPTTESGG